MKKFLQKYVYLILTFAVSFAIFFRSLFVFYTHDDFYFLKIANISSLNGFFNFFNLVKDVEGIGVYRPLTLRVFYFLTVEFFHLNPLPLHIISFITFFIIIFLVGKLAKLLTGNTKIALLSSFLYAVSVTHFGQLYYVGAFQELLLTLLFLASVIFFIKYETESKHSIKKLAVSFLFFILALMSKETAVVLPFIFVLTHSYLKLTKRINVSVKRLTLSLSPFIITLGIYLFLHFNYFGLISGDSYIWNFAPGRALNTLSWYGLWSFNLPEMLIDFVGPGFRLNPNLLTYWSKEIIPILALFVVQVCIVVYTFVRSKFSPTTIYYLLFAVLWFMVTLSPILFLPVHKFTYYLTLPLVGVVLTLGYLLNESKMGRVGIGLFLLSWTVLSILSLRLTLQTNWIIQGENVSERVYLYFSQNKFDATLKQVVFVDTPEDASLPWSPTMVLKTVLSEKNFFDVFYPSLSVKIKYAGLDEVSNTAGTEIIKSRQFLGY